MHNFVYDFIYFFFFSGSSSTLNSSQNSGYKANNSYNSSYSTSNMNYINDTSSSNINDTNNSRNNSFNSSFNSSPSKVGFALKGKTRFQPRQNIFRVCIALKRLDCFDILSGYDFHKSCCNLLPVVKRHKIPVLKRGFTLQNFDNMTSI